MGARPRDAELFRDMGDRPPRQDALNQDHPTRDSEPGITVNHEKASGNWMTRHHPDWRPSPCTAVTNLLTEYS